VTFISGGTTSKLFWPDGSIPSSFTICSITRYTGGSTQRILRGAQGNWLHGHYGGDRGSATGSVYYETWMVDYNSLASTTATTDWAVVCGSNGLQTPTNVLYNNIPIGTASGGAGGNKLVVNYSNELSDWALSFVAIWDQHLGAEEMQTASDALMEYLATGRSILEAPTTAPPCSMVSSVTSTTITTSNGTTTTTAITNIPCPEESA